SSRAVSSISLAGIGGMLEELHPSIFSALTSPLRQRLSSIFSAFASPLRQCLSSIFSALASPLRQCLSSIFSALASPLRQCLGSNCGPSLGEEREKGQRLLLRSSRRSLYSMESTRACQEASMMLSATPTVPHVSLPSPEVMSTRVRAAVPLLSSR